MTESAPPCLSPDILHALAAVGRPLSFGDGALIRERGTFAPDFLLITSGEITCILTEDGSVSVAVGPGAIVGEIGFLTGAAANATLRASGAVEAVSIDAGALAALRQGKPEMAAEVLRHLAEVFAARMAGNAALLAPQGQSAITVVRCSTLDQRRMAERVRYDVRCLERGEVLAAADTSEGALADPLDTTGATFLVLDHGTVVGTARVNLGRDVGLDALTLRQAAEVPLAQTAFVTDLVLRAAFEVGPALIALIDAMVIFATNAGAACLLADAVQSHRAAFETLGFGVVQGATWDDQRLTLGLTLVR